MCVQLDYQGLVRLVDFKRNLQKGESQAGTTRAPAGPELTLAILVLAYRLRGSNHVRWRRLGGLNRAPVVGRLLEDNLQRGAIASNKGVAVRES